MTRKEIASLGCKILALWLFAQAAITLGSTIGMIVALIGRIRELGTPGDMFADMLVIGVPGTLTLIAGLVIWCRADALASRMVPEDPAPVSSGSIGTKGLMIVAFATSGLFILTGSLRSAASLLIVPIQTGGSFMLWWSSPQWQSDLWSTAIRIILSIWLIFGAKGIANLVHRFRTVGVQQHTE